MDRAESLAAAGAKAALASQQVIRERFGHEEAEVTCVYPWPRESPCIARRLCVYALVLQVPMSGGGAWQRHQQDPRHIYMVRARASPERDLQW